MDCYRHIAEDRMAESLANEVIQASTGCGIAAIYLLGAKIDGSLTLNGAPHIRA